MKTKLLILLIIVSSFSTYGNKDAYKKIFEKKYGSELEGFEVISFSPTTKVLSYGWKQSGEKTWWGTFNVIEVDKKGTPLYWYDIPQPTTAQGIKRIRVVQLNDKKYIEVIDCTHKGNGMLYLYNVNKGVLGLMVKCRVMANLSVHFKPELANIKYGDLDGDGDDDIMIDGNCFEGNQLENSKKKAGGYHREYLFKTGSFVENIKKRTGIKILMD